MQLSRYAAAITTLTAALALAPSNPVVRLNRAIASLRAGELDAAQADYEQLLQISPHSYKVVFGLGEIAWRRQDTNAAIRNYQLYLANTATNTPEATNVIARLKELRPGAH